MWCWTAEEARAWCVYRSVALDESGQPNLPLKGEFSASIPLSKLLTFQTKYLSEFIATTLGSNDHALFWVTDRVFDANPHLFYKLRESYGERRMLFDAPGHYFLKYEFYDLASFVFLALVYQWDFYIFSDYLNIFVTHDGFLDVYSDQKTVASFQELWNEPSAGSV